MPLASRSRFDKGVAPRARERFDRGGEAGRLSALPALPEVTDRGFEPLDLLLGRAQFDQFQAPSRKRREQAGAFGLHFRSPLGGSLDRRAGLGVGVLAALLGRLVLGAGGFAPPPQIGHLVHLAMALAQRGLDRRTGRVGVPGRVEERRPRGRFCGFEPDLSGCGVGPGERLALPLGGSRHLALGGLEIAPERRLRGLVAFEVQAPALGLGGEVARQLLLHSERLGLAHRVRLLQGADVALELRDAQIGRRRARVQIGDTGFDPRGVLLRGSGLRGGLVEAAVRLAHLGGAGARDPAGVFGVDAEKLPDRSGRRLDSGELRLVVLQPLVALGDLLDQVGVERRQAVGEQPRKRQGIELFRQVRPAQLEQQLAQRGEAFGA